MFNKEMLVSSRMHRTCWGCRLVACAAAGAESWGGWKGDGGGSLADGGGRECAVSGYCMFPALAGSGNIDREPLAGLTLSALGLATLPAECKQCQDL